MHDLNETNPGLTLFSAELPWCCFCAEIKVLGMERNFARNFYIIYKNFWSQDLLERGPGWAQPTRAHPPLLAPRWVAPTWWPHRRPRDNIKSCYSRKNQGERIIAIHETEPPPSPVLPREGRSRVRLGLRRGGSSFFVITNPPLIRLQCIYFS